MPVVWHAEEAIQKGPRLVRASLRDSPYPFKMLGIEILGKNYPPTAFLNDHSNIYIFYSKFFASQK